MPKITVTTYQGTMSGRVFLLALAFAFFSTYSARKTTPTPSSQALACRRFMDGVSTFGHDCSTNTDCTKVTCTLQKAITYSIALEKCTRPVRVVLSVKIPAYGVSETRTFEGEQRVPINGLPSQITFFFGQPYLNVEAKRASAGGVTLSVGIWFDSPLGQWKRYSLFKRETIPVDTSSCATIETDVIPSQFTDYHDYDYETTSFSDALEKWLSVFNFGGGGGSSTIFPPMGGSTMSPPMNGGGSALEKLKHSVVGWLRKNNSAADKCVDQSLKTVYGITLRQLFRPHFQLKQEHRLRHFEQEMRACTGTTEKPVSDFAVVDYSMCINLLQSPKMEMPTSDEDTLYERMIQKCFGMLKFYPGPQASPTENSNSNHTDAIIIGSTVGGAVFIATIIILIVVLSIRSKKRSLSGDSSQIVYGKLDEEA